MFKGVSRVGARRVNPRSVVGGTTWAVASAAKGVPLVTVLSRGTATGTPGTVPVRPVVDDNLQPGLSAMGVTAGIGVVFAVPVVAIYVVPPPSTPTFSGVHKT